MVKHATASGNTVDLLLKENGTPCISIIAPGHQLFSDHKVDAYLMRRHVSAAKELLEKQAGDEAKSLSELLERLSKDVVHPHGATGIGLFVSKNIQQWVPFYFPVTEKITISHSFDTRDLLYQDFFAMDYHVLLLSKDKARLFAGKYNQLEELDDAHFPAKFEDDYEYSRPTRGLTYEGHAVTKAFEREKSQLNELREEAFFKKVDELLKKSIAPSDALLVAGAEKEIACFVQTTTFTNIIGKLHGNYFYLSVPALGETTWRIVKNFLQVERRQHIEHFEEKTGRGEAVSGMCQCWQAAFGGQGAHLLVEKDFSCTGYLSNDQPGYLHLTPPKGSYQVLPDAVSSLIGLVQEKGGDVMLVENDALKHFQHVGLVTRY